MVDNLGYSFDLKHPTPFDFESRYEPFEQYGLPFKPKWKNQYKFFSSNYKNFYLEHHHSYILVFNSIHRYKHGSNSTQFTYSSLYEAIHELDSFFEGNILGAKLLKLEYGVNIENYVPPNWQFYKGKDFELMTSKGKRYGKRFRFSDYHLKCYDKSFEQENNHGLILKKPVYRVEKVVKYMRHLKKYPSLVKVSDLTSKANLRLLKTDLLTNIRQIEYSNAIDLSKLTYSEKKLYAAYQNKEFRMNVKRHHKESYKKDVLKYRKLLKENELEYRQEFLTHIDRIFENLLAN